MPATSIYSHSAKGSVLVVCVHNSARSQMAEAYIRSICGECFEVESAGLEPGSISPLVVDVMREDGFDLSDKGTQSVFELHKQGRRFSHVVAVCSREAEERCPHFAGTEQRFHWPFDDPSKASGTRGEQLAEVRRIRDQIRTRVAEFCSQYCSEQT